MGSKVEVMEEELAAVKPDERLEWLAHRWANALATDKRLGERVKAAADRVEEARASLATAERDQARCLTERGEAAAAAAWCRTRIGEMFSKVRG